MASSAIFLGDPAHDLIEKIIDIVFTVDNSISKSQMRLEWINIAKIIDTFDTRNYQEFVIEIHHWLRVQKSIGYAFGQWNFFLALMTEPNCDCICSSSFILLCCMHVNLFGNSVIAAYTEKHIFLMNKDKTFVFETTYLCRTQWESITKFYSSIGINVNENFLTITNQDELLSIISTNIVVNTQSNQYTTSMIDILHQYPSEINPSYLLIVLTSAIRGGQFDSQTMFSTYNKILEIINKYKLYNTYHSMLHQIIMSIRDPAYIDRTSPEIVRIAEKAYILLLHAKLNSPYYNFSGDKIDTNFEEAKNLIDNPDALIPNLKIIPGVEVTSETSYKVLLQRLYKLPPDLGEAFTYLLINGRIMPVYRYAGGPLDQDQVAFNYTVDPLLQPWIGLPEEPNRLITVSTKTDNYIIIAGYDSTTNKILPPTQ